MIPLLPVVALIAATAGAPAPAASPDAAPDSRVKDSQVKDSPVKDSRDKVFYPSDTERAGPLTRKLLGNVLLDQKDIWTSPFRISRSNAKWWIGFTGLTAALIATDSHTIHTFNNSPGQVRWGNHISNIGSAYTVAGIAGAFYLSGVLVNNSKARETGVLGAEAMIDGLIVAEALKLVARRPRPDASADAGHFFHGGSSFPSGHAIASWALASVIADEYRGTPAVPVIAYGLASVVSAARFAAQKHYLSDIVAGGAMGYFIGHHVTRMHQVHSSHVHFAWNLMPQVQPAERSYGFTLALSKAPSY